jgi:hypothetical protein
MSDLHDLGQGCSTGRAAARGVAICLVPHAEGSPAQADEDVESDGRPTDNHQVLQGPVPRTGAIAQLLAKMDRVPTMKEFLWIGHRSDHRFQFTKSIATIVYCALNKSETFGAHSELDADVSGCGSRRQSTRRWRSESGSCGCAMEGETTKYPSTSGSSGCRLISFIISSSDRRASKFCAHSA